MSRICVWLSCLLRHKRHHTGECRRPVECLTEPDQDSSAAVRLNQLPGENFHCIADDQDSSTAVGLDKLPVDILQCITDFLPLDSAACLILSKKELASAMGDRIWPALHANSWPRIKFLQTMQRDWKEWVICWSCEKLHPLKKCPSLKTGIGSAGEPPCTMAAGVVDLMTGHMLRWRHAHMIMRLNKQNPMDHSWIRALSGVLFDAGNVPYAYCRGRIANGHLLIKVEYRILLRENEDIDHVQMLSPHICPHWNSVDRNNNLKRTLQRMLGCSILHETTEPCVLCNSIIECSWCATEFVMSVLKCDWPLYDRALYITAWKDFSACDSPFDPSWRTHCRLTRRLPSSLPREPVRFEPGSIRKAYEEVGYPKRSHDGIGSMFALGSDIEYARRLDECSKQDSTLSKIVRGGASNILLRPIYTLRLRNPLINVQLIMGPPRITVHTQ